MMDRYWQASSGLVHRNGPGRDQVPVAVVPYDDREAMERLLDAFNDADKHAHSGRSIECGSGSCWIGSMQAALREFADPKPPKPEEPTGLGAVVEDATGVLWVRAGDSHSDRLADNWRCTTGDEVGYWREWADLSVVRILSPGYDPEATS